MKKTILSVFLATIFIFFGCVGASNYTQELQDAYAWAYSKKITTMPTIDKANMHGEITRAQMAKMLSNWAKDRGQKPDSSKVCSFSDTASVKGDLAEAIVESCQLGLMGQGITKFRPNDTITRAEFGTALSRALWGSQYEGGDPYYTKHLNALKVAGIMNNISIHNQNEIRGYVMLMLMRAGNNLISHPDNLVVQNEPISTNKNQNTNSSIRNGIILISSGKKGDKIEPGWAGGTRQIGDTICYDASPSIGNYFHNRIKMTFKTKGSLNRKYIGSIGVDYKCNNPYFRDCDIHTNVSKEEDKIMVTAPIEGMSCITRYLIYDDKEIEEETFGLELETVDSLGFYYFNPGPTPEVIFNPKVDMGAYKSYLYTLKGSKGKTDTGSNNTSTTNTNSENDSGNNHVNDSTGTSEVGGNDEGKNTNLNDKGENNSNKTSNNDGNNNSAQDSDGSSSGSDNSGNNSSGNNDSGNNSSGNNHSSNNDENDTETPNDTTGSSRHCVDINVANGDSYGFCITKSGSSKFNMSISDADELSSCSISKGGQLWEFPKCKGDFTILPASGVANLWLTIKYNNKDYTKKINYDLDNGVFVGS